MNAWWQMWPGRYVEKTCTDLIKAGVQLPAGDGVIGFRGSARQDSSVRKSTIRWPPIGKRPWVGLVEQLESLFHEANRNAYGFDLWNLTEVQFTEYNGGNEDHYNWHEDVIWTNETLAHRKLSLVLQLSDPSDYEGGELELQHEPPEPQQVRSRGTVIIFPSFHQHRVTPITSGTRYSLVAWYTGPKFR